ncbi:MAG: hypothetical protein KGS61_08975 [Verrucomicrobia bacterium]|nr:hypothetical protein [Verrucomicrobiota bacterium]
MKNSPVTVDDLRDAPTRVLAAQRKTTVTGLVRDYLRGLTDGQKRRERARREILRMIGTFDCQIGRMPTREERHTG